MASGFRQDMPPPGGYAPIEYARVPHKRFFSGWTMLGLLAVSSAYATWQSFRWKMYVRKLDVEVHDTYLALQPFIQAERDRAFLKHLRHLREEERNLMKNHPGWVVGTLYGEPIYRSIPKDQLNDFSIVEYYTHRPKNELIYDHCWADYYL